MSIRFRNTYSVKPLRLSSPPGGFSCCFSSHQSFEYLKMDVELQISKDTLAQWVSAAGARETETAPLNVEIPEACTSAQVH